MKSICRLFFLLVTYISSPAQEAMISTLIPEDSISRVMVITVKASMISGKILLQWSATGKSGFYIIERSINSKDFEVIGAIKAKGWEMNFEFTDESLAMTRNYYRIKMQPSEGKSLYSNTIVAGIADSVFCKFYPNPVDKLLMIRSKYPVELQITDIIGKPRIIQHLKPGMQIIDVSCLEKNVYIITIFQEESNQFIIKKLVKN